jgi:4'-phosphopantetheinyl transferase
LKAVGEGLAAPLDSFDVTLAPGDPPRMLTLEGDAERAARWYLQHFRPAEQYIGALAIEGAPPAGGAWKVSTWAMAV